MPKVDLAAIEETNRTGYPAPFDEEVAGRWYRRLAPATGLSEFGASYVRLEPGAWSSQRHWHEGEDEMVVMLSGEAMLIEDDGESILRAGDVAAWPKGVRNAHQLVNRGDTACIFVAIGGGPQLGGAYADIDMKFSADGDYLHKDGTPYAAARV